MGGRKLLRRSGRKFYSTMAKSTDPGLAKLFSPIPISVNSSIGIQKFMFQEISFEFLFYFFKKIVSVVVWWWWWCCCF